MPELILKKTGQPVFVPPERLEDALASGLYEAPSGSEKVTVEVRPGVVGETTIADLPTAVARGATPESEQTFRGREREARIEREHGGPIGTAVSFVESGLNELTLGLTGALGELVGGEEYTERRLERKEANPIASTTGAGTGLVGGTLLSGGAGTLGKIARATPLGRATQLGTRIAKSGEGVGALSRAGRIVAGGAVEGAATGLGEGVQELVDASDPVTWERATSVLSSKMLFGAQVGAGAGLAAKVAEKGLVKAKSALDSVAERAGMRAGVADDLAKLDAKGLRAARQAELEAIEAARVPQRAEVAQEIAAFRKELKESKLWLATKAADDPEVRAIGRRTLKADKALDNLLDDPKALAENPKAALRQLRIQEAALDDLLTKHADNLRAQFAKDTSGARLKALDYASTALEKNRALQARITELAAEPTSARLQAIADAEEALRAGAREKPLAQKLLEGTVFSAASSATRAVPLVGAVAAPMVGAKVADMVGELVFGRIARATAELTQRTSAAIGKLLDTSKKLPKASPVLASKVLSRVSFGPPLAEPTKPKAERERTRRAVPVKSAGLAEVFKTRTDELRAQVVLAPDGRYKMRPEARARMAQQLAPIRAVSPVLADRMEATAARRIEFLASKMPRRPELAGIQVGPDHWRPSDFEMRAFARYVAAIEDPAGVVERVAAGTVTPEDAEALRAVYPEMYAQIQAEIIEKLPMLRKQLPYAKRVALSIFSGVPVDPAMDPQVLAVLQSTYDSEPGTDGGVHGPRAQPQFGSVKKSIPEPTPAQARAG